MSQDIQRTIADLEAWRERITTTIETLKYFLAQGPGLPSSPPPSGGRIVTGAEIPHDAFFQMTIPDAAKKYLAIVKQTKPNPQIAESLLKGGLKSAAKNFPETLRTILSRDDRFVRVNSEWGLAEWYSGMRKERKTHTSNEDDRPQSETTQKTEDNQQGYPLTTRTLALLNQYHNRIFSAEDVAKALDAKIPTVRTCLSQLFAKDLILRLNHGKYQSKDRHASNAA
jgi:hypothetical protein